MRLKQSKRLFKQFKCQNRKWLANSISSSCMWLVREDLEECGRLRWIKLENYMLWRKWVRPSKIDFYQRVIQKRSVNSVLNERYLLEHLYHPFLVNMSYSFSDRDNLYLVIDLLTGGDLRYHLGKMRRFSENQTSNISN